MKDVLCLILLLLLLQSMSTGQSFLFSGKTGPKITPNNPSVFFGEELILSCELPSGSNSSLAYFKVGYENVSEDFLSRPDEKTLVYRQTVSSNSVFNTGSCEGKAVYCYGGSLLPGSQQVYADYALHRPRNIECIYFDRRDIECTWNLDKAVNCARYYDVSSFISIEGSDLNCSSSTNESCRVTEQLRVVDMFLLIQITHKKNLSFVVNATETFDLSKLVKPVRVSSLKTADVTSRDLRVEWYHKSQDLQFRVRLTPINGTEFSPEVVKVVNGSQSETIVNLKPSVSYNITVDAKPIDGGIWSEKAFDVVTMPSTAPDFGPVSVPGAFSVPADNCTDSGGTRSITVFWQELSREWWNGQLQEYVLRYFPTGQPSETLDTKVSATETQATLSGLSCGQAYTVQLYAFNGEESANFTSLSVPRHSHVSPVSSLLIRLDGDSILASWSVSGSEAPDSFTLFWCRSLKNQLPCSEGVMEWRTVPGNRTTQRLPSLTEGAIADNYKFGISATHLSKSSDLLWSKCVYTTGAVPAQAPQGFSVVNYTDKVEVSWVSPECSPANQVWALVTAHRVRWCPSRNFKNNVCSSGGGSRLVHMREKTPDRTVLNDLPPNQLYTVVVEARTVDGKWGPPTNPLPAMRLPPTGLQSNALIGIIMGILLAVILGGAVLFCVIKCRRLKKAPLPVAYPEDTKKYPNDGYSNSGMVEDDFITSTQIPYTSQVSKDSGIVSRSASMQEDPDLKDGEKKSPATSPTKEMPLPLDYCQVGMKNLDALQLRGQNGFVGFVREHVEPGFLPIGVQPLPSQPLGKGPASLGYVTKEQVLPPSPGSPPHEQDYFQTGEKAKTTLAPPQQNLPDRTSQCMLETDIDEVMVGSDVDPASESLEMAALTGAAVSQDDEAVQPVGSVSAVACTLHPAYVGSQAEPKPAAAEVVHAQDCTSSQTGEECRGVAIGQVDQGMQKFGDATHGVLHDAYIAPPQLTALTSGQYRPAPVMQPDGEQAGSPGAVHAVSDGEDPTDCIDAYLVKRSNKGYVAAPPNPQGNALSVSPSDAAASPSSDTLSGVSVPEPQGAAVVAATPLAEKAGVAFHRGYVAMPEFAPQVQHEVSADPATRDEDDVPKDDDQSDADAPLTLEGDAEGEMSAGMECRGYVAAPPAGPVAGHQKMQDASLQTSQAEPPPASASLAPSGYVAFPPPAASVSEVAASQTPEQAASSAGSLPVAPGYQTLPPVASVAGKGQLQRNGYVAMPTPPPQAEPL